MVKAAARFEIARKEDQVEHAEQYRTIADQSKICRDPRLIDILLRRQNSAFDCADDPDKQQNDTLQPEHHKHLCKGNMLLFDGQCPGKCNIAVFSCHHTAEKSRKTGEKENDFIGIIRHKNKDGKEEKDESRRMHTKSDFFFN